MKRFMMFVLALAMLLSMAACASDTEKDESGLGLDDLAALTQPKKPTDQEVVEAALWIQNQLDNAVNEQNYNAFASLFIDTEDEDIHEYYEIWDTLDYYDQHYGIVLGEKDGYYYVSCVYAIVGGVVPNQKRESISGIYVIKKTGNTWKFAPGGADWEFADKLVIEKLPEEAQAALAENRNVVVFTDSLGLCFLDTSIYIKDDFSATVVYAWQDADGSVHVAVHLTNGTSINQAANNIRVMLRDFVMGTILKVVCDEGFVVPAYSSRIIIVDIYPGDVWTGTNLWSDTVYAEASSN